MIQAVLSDEQTICLRDLPAFYACATSLLYKLDEIGANKGRQEERFEGLFRSNYAKITATLQLREKIADLDSKLTE